MRKTADRNNRAPLAVLGWVVVSLIQAGGLHAEAVKDPFAACEELLRAQPEDYESFYCFYEAGRQQRQWRRAAARLEELIAGQPENHWPRLTLAHVYWRLDNTRAEAAYRAAAAGFRRQEQASGEILARTNLYSYLMRQGNLDRAAAEVDRVIEIAATAGDPILTARALILEADHLRDRGHDLETAYRLLRQAEPLVFPGGPDRLRRLCLTGLGSTSYRLGHYGEAQGYYQRLEEMARETGDDYARALAKYNQANTFLAENFELPTAGSRDRLLSMYREALAAAQAAGHSSAEGQSHRILGELLSRFEDSRGEARDHLDRCVTMAREMRRPRRISACLRALGSHLARWGEPQGAAEAFDESLELAREAGDHQGVARVLERRMRSSWADGPRPRALEDTLAALDAIEAMRDRQPAASGRAGLFAAWSDLYYWPAGRLLAGAGTAPAREDLELAFSLAERLRARVLLEAVARSRASASEDDGALAPVLADLVQTQRRLLDTDLSDGQRRRTLRQLERLEMSEAEARQPDPASGVTPGALAASFAKLAEVEAELAEDEALLSFQVALWKDVYGDFGGGSWLLASTRAGTRVYRLPDRIALRPATRLFTGLFDSRDGIEAGAASRLYSKLLAGALADMPPAVKRLVIVPDGVLHRFPFAALRSAPDAEPLARRLHFSHVPSATLWLRWRNASKPAMSATVLALADPLPPGVDGGTAAVQRDWALASGTRLGALPQAREEGRAVVRHLGGGSRLLVGAEATEHHLKSSVLEPYGVLHFAAHAVVDDEHPQRSAVLLVPGAAHEDGLLQPRDIAGLDLSGRVVVLSACQSASGAVLRGEGVQSLARAFFEADARAVVASLWRLRDDEAAALFDRFYHHLAGGESVAGALAAAQSDRIRKGAPAAAWAGLTVLGDGDAVPVPGGRPRSFRHVPGLILAAVLLVPAVAFWWRRSLS